MTDMKPADASVRTAILILGMHRSGTSALTRMFSLVGCALSKTLIGSHEGNELGHWESHTIAAFDEELLGSAGSAWDDFQPVHPEWYRSPLLPRFIERGSALLNHEYDDAPLFVLKDPRMCRLAPFWLQVFERSNIRPAIIMPLRHPLEVAASLSRRDGMDRNYAQLLWLRHVLDAEAASRGRERLFVSYDQLMLDWRRIAAKAEDAFGFAWPRQGVLTQDVVDSFLSEDHRHHTVARSGARLKGVACDWVESVWRILDGWVAGGEAAQEYEQLDAIREAFDAASPMFARTVNSLLREKAEQDAAQGLLAKEKEQADQALESARAEAVVLADQRDHFVRERDHVVGERDHFVRERDHVVEERDHFLRERDHFAGEVTAVRATLAEAEAMVARSQAQVEGLDALRAECDKLAALCAAAQAQLGERDRALLASADDVTNLQQQLAELEAQLGAGRSAFAELLEALEQERAASANDLAGAQARLEEAEAAGLAQAHSHSHQQADLESALRQRAEEAAQAWQELANAQDALMGVSADLAALREKEAQALAREAAMAERLADSEGWVFKLAGERRHAVDELARAQQTINRHSSALQAADAQILGLTAKLDSTLKASQAAGQKIQAAREEAQAVREAAEAASEEAQAAREEAQTVREAAEAARKETQAAIVDAQKAQAEVEAVRQDAEWQAKARSEQAARELAEVKAAFEASERQATVWRAQAEAAQAELLQERGLLRAKSGEIEGARSVNRDLQHQLSGERERGSRLASALRKAESAQQPLQQRADWLGAVTVAVNRQPLWWSLLLPKVRRRKLYRKLERLELFDHDTYLAHYPDVAASGADPLQHYLNHGMAEGRSPK